MIIQIRKNPMGRKLTRVDKPIGGFGQHWSADRGHQIDLGPYSGQDGIEYSVILTAADLAVIFAKWESQAGERKKFDDELHSR